MKSLWNPKEESPCGFPWPEHTEIFWELHAQVHRISMHLLPQFVLFISSSNVIVFKICCFVSVLWTTLAHELNLCKVFGETWFRADHSEAQIRWKGGFVWHSEYLFDDSHGYRSFSARDVTLSPWRQFQFNWVRAWHWRIACCGEKSTHLSKLPKSFVLISEQEEGRPWCFTLPQKIGPRLVKARHSERQRGD